MSICKFPRPLSIAGLTVGLVLAAPFAGAASHCKGISENACVGDAACVWVASYTRKDGRTVSGHCKLRRGKKAMDLSSAKAASPTRAE